MHTFYFLFSFYHTISVFFSKKQQWLSYFLFFFLQGFLDEVVEGEENDDEEEDIDRFNVKPQFQGEQGEKVIKPTFNL